jgi:hypothetical protein
MLTKIMLEHIPAPAAEAWRNEYRGRRYLRRLGIGELRARLIYLARSLITLKPDGRLGLLGQEVPLWQAFAETCEEAALRRESVDELLKGVKMPDSDFAPNLADIRFACKQARRTRRPPGLRAGGPVRRDFQETTYRTSAESVVSMIRCG